MKPVGDTQSSYTLTTTSPQTKKITKTKKNTKYKTHTSTVSSAQWRDNVDVPSCPVTLASISFIQSGILQSNPGVRGYFPSRQDPSQLSNWKKKTWLDSHFNNVKHWRKSSTSLFCPRLKLSTTSRFQVELQCVHIFHPSEVILWSQAGRIHLNAHRNM